MGDGNALAFAAGQAAADIAQARLPEEIAPGLFCRRPSGQRSDEGDDMNCHVMQEIVEEIVVQMNKVAGIVANGVGSEPKGSLVIGHATRRVDNAIA